jgi:hypothetical protein
MAIKKGRNVGELVKKQVQQDIQIFKKQFMEVFI